MSKWLLKNTWIWSFVGAFALLIPISMLGANGFNVKTLFMNVTLASFAFLLGISEMLVITSGNGAIDLSVSYTVTLCAYISAAWLRPDGNILVGILIILGICVLVGLINGAVTVYLNINAMIGTLAVGYIVYSFVLVYSVNATVRPSEALSAFVQMQFSGFSVLTILCILFAFIMHAFTCHLGSACTP